MEELEVIVQRMIDAGESEDNIKLVIEEYTNQIKSEDVAKTDAVVGEGATTPAGTDSASEGGSLESQEIGFDEITQDLVSKDEEIVVPKLNEIYGKDFEFEEAGILDGILIRNKKTGNKELFSLDSFTDKGDIDSAKEMRLWMKESQNKTETEVQNDYDINRKELEIESKKLNKKAEDLIKERNALEMLVKNKSITSDKDQRLIDYSKKEADVFSLAESLEQNYNNINKDFDSDIKKAPFVEKKFFSGNEEMSIPIPNRAGKERSITVTKEDFGSALAMIDDFTENYSFIPDLGDFVDGMAGALTAGGYQADLAVLGNKAGVLAESLSKEDMKKLADTHEAMSKIPRTQESFEYNKQYDKIIKDDKGSTSIIPLSLKAMFISAVSNPQEAAQIALTSWVGMMNNASLTAAGTVIGAGATAGGTVGVGVSVPTTGGLAAPVTGAAGAVTGAAMALPYAMASAGVMVETGLTIADGIREVIQEENKKRIANGESPVKYDAKSIEAVLNDGEAMNKLRVKGVTRGLTIGVIDLFAAKLGMKVGKKIFGKTGSTFGQFLGTLPIEAGGEFTGEAMAMLITEGKVNWKEATSEILGSGPSAVVDVVATIPGRNKSVYKVNGGFSNKRDFVGMIKNATPLEVSKMGDVVIKNDESTSKLFNDKLKQAGVIRELKEANPNLNDTQLESISQLQIELNDLNGNNTEVSSNRKKELKDKIKEIEESKQGAETEAETIEQPATDVPSDGQNNGKKVGEVDNEISDYIAESASSMSVEIKVGELEAKIDNAEYINEDDILDAQDKLIGELDGVENSDNSENPKEDYSIRIK